jgi:hypothetical protein
VKLEKFVAGRSVSVERSFRAYNANMRNECSVLERNRVEDVVAVIGKHVEGWTGFLYNDSV